MCFVVVWFQSFWWHHDDVIKWKHFPRYWPFVWRNSLVTVEFPSQKQVTGRFDFSLICAWIKGWVNNREAGDLSSSSLWRHSNDTKYKKSQNSILLTACQWNQRWPVGSPPRWSMIWYIIQVLTSQWTSRPFQEHPRDVLMHWALNLLTCFRQKLSGWHWKRDKHKMIEARGLLITRFSVNPSLDKSWIVQ